MSVSESVEIRARLLEPFAELRGRAFWVLLGCLVCQMGLGITYVSRPLAPFLIEELDLTRAAFSSASIPQLLAQSLASPLVGVLAVRLGASRVLAFGAALFTAVFLFFAQVESLAGLYFAMAGVGLAAACMGDVAIGHVVSGWTQRSRGLALGIAYAGSNLGGFVLAQLFIGIATGWDWQAGLLSISAVAICVLLPAALWWVKEPPPSLALEMEASVAESAEDATGPGAAVVDDGESLDLRAALRTRSFWILATALFTFFFYFQGILDHLVLFLVDTGMSRVDATFYFSQAVGLGVVSKLLGGLLADRISHLRGIQIDFGLLALSSGVLLWMPDATLLWVFVFTYGFAYPARDVVYPLVLGHCFGVRYLGEIYGAMMLALPAGALGSIFAATIFDHDGNYDTAFASFAALNLFAFALLFGLRNERERT
jgi:sugar phosphate permease